jgi:RNA polymerase sigma factor (sigma-70 family)
MIRVLLVEDHAAFLQTLAFRLDREPDMTVVGQAGRIEDARSMLSDVDVAVIDLDLPNGNGVDLIRDIRRVNRQAAVLILTASVSRMDAARAVEAGADGVLHKSARVVEIIDAVRKLAAGEQILTQAEIIELLRLSAQRREQDHAVTQALQRLTPREREVLEAVSRGGSDKEIAQELSVSHETVRTHMVNILGKLGVDSRLQALLLAVRHGFIKLDD